VTGWFNYRQ